MTPIVNLLKVLEELHDAKIAKIINPHTLATMFETLDTNTCKELFALLENAPRFHICTSRSHTHPYMGPAFLSGNCSHQDIRNLSVPSVA